MMFRNSLIKALIIAFSVIAGRCDNWVHITLCLLVIYGLFDLYDFIKKHEKKV